MGRRRLTVSIVQMQQRSSEWMDIIDFAYAMQDFVADMTFQLSASQAEDSPANDFLQTLGFDKARCRHSAGTSMPFDTFRNS